MCYFFCNFVTWKKPCYITNISPESEIEKAIKLKNEYYAEKQQ